MKKSSKAARRPRGRAAGRRAGKAGATGGKAGAGVAGVKAAVKKKLTTAERKALHTGGRTASDRPTTKAPIQRAASTGAAARTKRMSLLDAAAQVLAKASEPMNTPQIVAKAAEQKLWTPGEGKTPANTLHASIAREIKVKGDAARFEKVARGRFRRRNGT